MSLRFPGQSFVAAALLSLVLLSDAACKLPGARGRSAGAPGQDYLAADFRCETGKVGIEKSDAVMERYEAYREEFHKRNRKKGRAFAVILGDSIAALFHRGRLEKYLADFDVVNRGIPGDTTPLLEKRIARDALVLKPRFLIISIGGNDILNGRCLGTVLKNTDSILKNVRLHSPETKVLLVSVPPVLSWKANSITPYYNRKLEYLAHRRGALFHDLWPLLSESESPRLDKPFHQELPGGRIDRVHFNDEGYRRWAQRLRPILKAGAGSDAPAAK